MGINQLNYPENKIRYPQLNDKFIVESIINPSLVIPGQSLLFTPKTQLSQHDSEKGNTKTLTVTLYIFLSSK